MKAAIVSEAGHPPAYGDLPDPVAGPGEILVRMSAASLSHVTRGRASGRHYSAAGGAGFVPGVDGVGRTPDGRRVYVLALDRRDGTMAERCVASEALCIPLPDAPGTIDDIAAAAMAIPGMSSWAALVERAGLRAGETVLVNGATGISGRLAIQVAKHLGAGKVIATGRDASAFDELRRLGADAVVALSADAEALEHAFQAEFRQRVDVVLDYLWGPSAQALVVAAAKAGSEGVPVRHVQIGSIGGASIELPGAALRSSALQLMGSGIGSVPVPRLLAAIRGVLEAAPAAGFEVATRALPLAEVERAWTPDEGRARIVLQP
jgi:NADPH:quinone reductase-like Zn-dependent oxidoreductase